MVSMVTNGLSEYFGLLLYFICMHIYIDVGLYIYKKIRNLFKYFSKV
jgi:hypothetical protein